ncbi:XRE family transcriptional regulator [uncultured Desulfovibrio sp.]|uniref:XRE family transcriptional regulator n=1 Tax=uncultured Desulfovibrio sp. TaxID=167968 RepID=UPI00261E0664|nr:XRE family transcriptional regulator [uncultured Desulfovibrio sp.]
MSAEKSPHFYLQNLDPGRIKFARELHGLTKKELAEKIGKTPSAVTQYEAGRSGLSLETFTALAHALSVPFSFFSKCNHPLPTASFSECHFRANRRVPQMERLRAFSFAVQVFSIFSYLADRGVHFPETAFPTFDGSQVQEREIEKYAVEVRSAANLGLGPIPNMAGLLESLGVRIILLPAREAKLDGFATWFEGTPCVMIDSNSAASRMQFDYAHELAHLIFDEESTPEDPLVERRANRFASAFLMPATSFRADCPQFYRQSHFVSVKKYWHVSIAAALYRARELGILSEKSYKSAQISRSRAGTRMQEEEEFPPSMPSLLDQAMRLVCHDVRLDEMALDLGMSQHGLRDILELQNVSPDVLDVMTPPTKKARIIDFSVYRDTD